MRYLVLLFCLGCVDPSNAPDDSPGTIEECTVLDLAGNFTASYQELEGDCGEIEERSFTLRSPIMDCQVLHYEEVAMTCGIWYDFDCRFGPDYEHWAFDFHLQEQAEGIPGIAYLHKSTRDGTCESIYQVILTQNQIWHTSSNMALTE